MKKRRVILLINLILVLCLCLSGQEPTIDPAALGGLKARMIGPAVMSGRITAIDCVSTDTRTIYVGAAGGGVWKSTNGGVSFSQVFGQNPLSIGCLTIDQKNPDTIWVGTGECNVRNSVSMGAGLFLSQDAGKNWQLMGFKDSERISEIVVDPSDSKTVYVAVMGHLWNAHPERGVYKTTDSGKTWERLLYVDENTGCADLEMDPQETNVLYAAMWEFRRLPYFFNSGGQGSGLYKSTDKGKTWKKIHKGLPDGPLGRIAIAAAPSRPGTLYATVEAKKTALYRSDEMGENWQQVNETLGVTFRPFYFSHLAIDPKDHRTLYIAGLFMGFSEDAGLSVMPRGSVHSDIHAIWVDPGNSQHVLIGTDGGVYQSFNKGQTCTMIACLPVSQFYHVSYDMDTPYNVYGGLQDNGSWYGPAAKFGGAITNKDWTSIGIGDGFHLFRHPKDPDIIYYDWQGGRLTRVNERSGESKDIQPLPMEKGEPEYRFNWNTPVVLSPMDPEILFIGAQFLFKSTDRGDSFQKISPDLTTNDPQKLQQEKSGGLTIDNTTAENHCTIYTIAPSPIDTDIIWVGTDDGNLQLTRDCGKTWQNLVKQIPGLPAHTWCSSIEASRHHAGTAFATFDGHQTGDMKPYVYRTEDFGKTWTSLASPVIQGFCHIIRQDLVKGNLLFLGTEFGLFASIDNGQQWFYLKEALPQVPVRDLAIHPREHDLIIATHGLGIQIIDDITPLRSLTPEVLNAPAAVLACQPARLKNSSISQDFPGDAEFFGDNAPGGATITYYLKKRHIFGDLKLEIIDAAGKVIQTLPTGKRSGLNQVNWGMRLKAPKIPVSPGLPRYLPIGPQVAEGTYTVRLTKVNETFTGKIDVITDSLSGHSKEDRALQHDTLMKVYYLQEDLGYMSDTVDNLDNQVKKMTEAAKGKALPKKLADYREKLDRFHRSIIQHGGITSGEKLMENVIGLYSSIIQYGGRPTQSQIYHVQVLKDRVAGVEKEFKRLTGPELAAVNQGLKEKLKLLNKEDYSKEK